MDRASLIAVCCSVSYGKMDDSSLPTALEGRRGAASAGWMSAKSAGRFFHANFSQRFEKN